MATSFEEKVRNILSSTTSDGRLRARESTTVEFKESFGFKSLSKYLKTIAAFANTKGGVIVFGVTDNPRALKGIELQKFERIKVEQLSTYLSDYFSPEIGWDIGTVEREGKVFGYIGIEESSDKPVICKKDAKDDLKDGDIYYRYRGVSRRIGFPELKRIQLEIRERERKLWMEHIEQISRVGPQNVALLDLFSGKLESSNIGGNFVIDENLLDTLKRDVAFIEEGHFEENGGEPTLKLVGDVTPAETITVPNLDPNKDYPFLVKHLADELQIRPYDAQVMIWVLGLKESKRFCIEVRAGKSYIVKYSKYALSAIKDELAKHDDMAEYLQRMSKEYQSRGKR